RGRFSPLLEALEDRLAPATITVTTTKDVVNPDDHKTSLREALSMANQKPNADIIVLPKGVYRIEQPISEYTPLNTSFTIAAAVTIRGAGSGNTIVDGSGKTRVFNVIGSGAFA